jgi:ABC-2 type transport system ATP-binding protein
VASGSRCYPLGDSSLDITVEIRHLTHDYGAVRAVDDLDLTITAGTVTALLGPNGAGKTTTLECCEGLRRADSGTVRVLGLDPVHDAKALRPRVGVQLQEGGLHQTARTGELLWHAAAMYRNPLPVADLAERLGLPITSKTPYRRLSGGQQRRLAIAIALMGRPDVVFLDEPTAGLDPQGSRTVWEMLTELRNDGVTVVVSTHLMADAEEMADDVAIIDAGRVIAAGSPARLISRAEHGPMDTVQFSASTGWDLAGLRQLLGAAATVEEARPGRYQVRGLDGPRLLLMVADWCRDHNVRPNGLRVDQRTLEDVFMELTGRALRP